MVSQDVQCLYKDNHCIFDFFLFYWKISINRPIHHSEIEIPPTFITTNDDYQTKPLPPNSVIMGYLM